MDQLKQFIPLVIAIMFFVGAAHPKPFFMKAARERHPEHVIADIAAVSEQCPLLPQ
jgi:hypothetical protein